MVAKIKKGDRVLVMSGRDKGKAGDCLLYTSDAADDL